MAPFWDTGVFTSTFDFFVDPFLSSVFLCAVFLHFCPWSMLLLFGKADNCVWPMTVYGLKGYRGDSDLDAPFAVGTFKSLA